MRDNYDDMDNPTRMSRGNGNSRKLLLLVILLIVLFLIGLVCFLMFYPNKNAAKTTEVPVTVVSNSNVVTTTEVKEEEIIIVPPKPVEPIVVPETVTPVAADTKPVTNVSALDISEVAKTNTPSKAIKYIDHTVQEGEDLSSIANLYDLKVETLISVNKIKNISGITKDEVLRIPDRDGVLYAVKYGDMLSTVARKYNPEIGWQTLQELNNLKNDNIKVGQEIFIPDYSESSNKEILKNTVEFMVPIKGTLTGTFLQRLDGTVLNGVYYTAPAGSAVVASADGTVFDIGNDSALGRFVSITHADGYKTTYAYLETVDAKLGKVIKKGDILGSIGTASGKMSRPTLYFMLEQGGIALDPSLFY